MNIVAIIQARMGSTRLPGKVMMDIVGRPMLWHIVNRLSYSELINKIVVATSKNRENDVIEKFCIEHNIEIYRGSELDLVDRFYQVATLYKVDVIVRITADCPLVDPQLTDKVIEFFIKEYGKYDYVSNSRPKATYPHGLDVEAFSFFLLRKLWIELKDPFWREWFTTEVFQNPHLYRIFCIENKEDLSHIRLTVDYPEDLELIRYIYNRLYLENHCFYLEDILKLYTENPAIFEINKNYFRDQQLIEEMEKRRGC